MNDSSRISHTLNLIDAGNQQASADLVSMVYDELQNRLATHDTLTRSDPILQTTAIVHRTYVELTGPETQELSESGAQFYLAASGAMRRILTEFAKSQVAVIGNTNDPPQQANDVRPATPDITPGQLLQLDHVLQKLEQIDHQAALFVQLRLYGGLPTNSAAKVLRISHDFADGLWDYAQTWFALELADEQALGVDS